MNNVAPAWHEVGVVAALPAEAAAWTGRGHAPGGAARRVVQAGIGAERAAKAAARLLDEGARALLCWGVAGGLDARLRPGSLVLPRRVVSGGVVADVDAAWRGALHAALEHAGEAVSSGDLWCGRDVLASRREKCRLAAAHAVVAVDMESAAVASVARGGDVPFVVIRAVCDPAWRDVPADLLRLLGADGALRLHRLPALLGRGPRMWRGLVRMRRDYHIACRSLGRAARAVEEGA